MTDTTDLSNDILEGADQIASFLYCDPKKRSKVYPLVENKRLPTFKIGKTICARKSTLLAWIAEQEQAA